MNASVARKTAAKSPFQNKQTFIYYACSKQHMTNRAADIFFGTLSNKNRLHILEEISKNPMTESDICKVLNINQSTASHNLRRLQITGFVKSKKHGKYRVYEADNEVVKPLLKLVRDHLKCNCDDLCACKEDKLKKKLKR